MKAIKLFFLSVVFTLLFVQQADAQGWLWAKSAGGSGRDDASSVITDGAGNVYATGFFTSTSLTFGTTTLTNSGSGSADIFVVKYDTTGNVLWAKSAGGNFGDYAYSVTTDGYGNAYVTGSFSSPTIIFGTTTLTNIYTTGSSISSITDIFVVKYDASGNVIWAKSAGGNSDDAGQSVTTDGAGNLYVTGYFYSSTISFGSTTLTNTGVSSSSDIFVVKYDASGNVIWAKSAGGSSGDFIYSIITDGTGNVYVTGDFTSPTINFGATTLTNVGVRNIFVVKYDASGNVFWARSVGGNLDDHAQSITTDGAGNVYVTGHFHSNSIAFGATTLTNAGYDDIFVAKYASTLSTPNILNETHNLDLYPNPTTGTITLTTDNPTAITALKVCDMLGKTVYEHGNIEAPYFCNQSVHLDLPVLPDGIYMLWAIGSEKTEYLKFVVKK